jgi:hypothetical protein
MKIIFFFLLVGIMLLVGFFGLIWFVIRMLFSVSLQPGTKSWDGLVQKMRKNLEIPNAQLIPWDTEMLSLLSLNKPKQPKSSFFSSEIQGFYTTIYDESVVSFAQNTMQGMGLTIANTTQQEFILRNKGNETEIWVNKQPLGVYINGVLLASGKNPRQLALIQINANEVQFPLNIGEKTVAAISNPIKADAPNPRAVILLKDLNKEEEIIVLAMALLVMQK